MVAVKWFDNCGVTMVGTFLEECNKVSTATRRVNRQSVKIPVPCPEMIKDYNSGMGGVISSIKKQLRANWTVSHLVGVITLD